MTKALGSPCVFHNIGHRWQSFFPSARHFVLLKVQSPARRRTRAPPLQGYHDPSSPFRASWVRRRMLGCHVVFVGRNIGRHPGHRGPHCRVAVSYHLSLIHISEPTRLLSISYAVFCLKKK